MNRFITFLWVLFFLLLIQILLGGITRLTESGLSITRWDLFSGIVPPLSSKGWQEAFDLYKATPQFQLVNTSISLAEFKTIFWWEYIHRLWGRLLGLGVLGFAAVTFLVSPVVYKGYQKRFLVVILLLFAVVGSFGWLMVASGLRERPWVNAYNLSLHLSLALLLVLTVVFGLVVSYREERGFIAQFIIPYKLVAITFLLAFVQVFLGGMLAGMKVAVMAPTYPDINGRMIPLVITDLLNWRINNFTQYDESPFLPMLVHFLHRTLAILLVGLSIGIAWYGVLKNVGVLRFLFFILGIVVFCQFVLGILTIINSLGNVPVVLGVLHQLFGVLFLSILFAILAIGYASKKSVVKT